MPKTLTQYRIFIGSPGGLDDERRCFREKVIKYAQIHSEPRLVNFHPVGWEETVGGVGRPQELINDDLRQCDYAVFILHDRWGSSTGDKFSSGVEEEMAIAEKLYEEKKIKNIALLFKEVDPEKMRDPGPQLASVIAFRKRITDGKRYLFRQFSGLDQLSEAIEANLARWLTDHESAIANMQKGIRNFEQAMPGDAKSAKAAIAEPNFSYWMAEADKLMTTAQSDPKSALFCASKARDVASSNVEWARAQNLIGINQSNIGDEGGAVESFSSISDRFFNSEELECQHLAALALLNTGVALRSFGRNAEQLAVYDELLARYGNTTESIILEQVGRALVNKAITFGRLDQDEEELTLYDDILYRFGKTNNSSLLETIARTLLNKGVCLGRLGRNSDELIVYNDLLERFGKSGDRAIAELVATALFYKGITLDIVEDDYNAMETYNELIFRFGELPEIHFRELVADALMNKARNFDKWGRHQDEIRAYDDLISRFGEAEELILKAKVAKSLFNKGITLGENMEKTGAIAVFDNIIERFSSSTEQILEETVFKSMLEKYKILSGMGDMNDASSALDTLLSRADIRDKLSLKKLIEDLGNQEKTT